LTDVSELLPASIIKPMSKPRVKKEGQNARGRNLAGQMDDGADKIFLLLIFEFIEVEKKNYFILSFRLHNNKIQFSFSSHYITFRS
jgi:hypothetical protein